jgi:hypothetical protein
VDVGGAVREWQANGFLILPGFVPAAELRPALEELPAMYPTAERFHDGTDERRGRFTADEWAGIDSFPFLSAELSLLAVSDRVVDLVDVPGELGPPRLLSRARTTGLPAKPNWYPREGGADAEGGWVETSGRPDLYDAEVPAAGPAGTVVAWAPETFRRGTALTLPRGARYTIHLVCRPARAEWGQRMSWVIRSHEPAWYRFMDRATPRQLALFGFPPPGHPYWTEATLAGTTQRYPGLDITPWRQAPRGGA